MGMGDMGEYNAFGRSSGQTLLLPIFSHNMIYLNLSTAVQKIIIMILYYIAPWPWYRLMHGGRVRAVAASPGPVSSLQSSPVSGVGADGRRPQLTTAITS